MSVMVRMHAHSMCQDRLRHALLLREEPARVVASSRLPHTHMREHVDAEKKLLIQRYARGAEQSRGDRASKQVS